MLGRKSPEQMTEREKVAARRKEVLSRGRKFKYPLQYAKHHIAIVASIISIVTLILICVLTWASLYKFNATGNIVYRLTEVLPLPVANVDGESVRYSDYLLFYRSSTAAIGASEDAAEADLEYKKAALRSAEEYSFALKLAREQNITISEEDITALFDQHLKAGGTDRSKASYLKILSDNFGLSESEYRRMLRLLLAKIRVSAAIDSSAATLATSVESAAKTAASLEDVKNSLASDQVIYEDTGGLLDYDNIDGGRASVAATLEPGQVSDKFVSTSGDAYYIVKVLEKTDNKLSYASLKIPFTEFEKRFNEIIESGNLSEFISLQNE